jgi:hypothetical protein
VDPAGIRREVFLTESGDAALLVTVSILLQVKSGDHILVMMFLSMKRYSRLVRSRQAQGASGRGNEMLNKFEPNERTTVARKKIRNFSSRDGSSMLRRTELPSYDQTMGSETNQGWRVDMSKESELLNGVLVRDRSFQKLRGVLAGGALARGVLVRQILQKLRGVLAGGVLAMGVLARG